MWIPALLAFLMPQCSTDMAATANGELGKVLESLCGKQWEERGKAFDRLMRMGGGNRTAQAAQRPPAAVASLLERNPKDANQIQMALINALELENSMVRTQKSLSGDFTDYYGDLISAVAALKDPRSAEALAGALGTGNMAVRALAGFGDPAVEPVLKRLSSTKAPTVTFSACMTLRMMSSPAYSKNLTDPANVRKVNEALGREPCKH